MNHLLLGASLPFLIATVIYIARGCRAGLPLLTVTPLAMTACALWASAPDIPRLLGLNGLYLRLSLDPRINIFLWHYTIDQIEVDSSWYAVGIGLIAAALMGVAVRQLFLEERR